MIIRATFNDNDFTKYLEEYFENFKINILKLNNKYLEKEAKKYINNDFLNQFLSDLTDKGVEELDKETKAKYTKIIKDSILFYLENKVDKDTFKYLKKNLLTVLRRRLEPKWENGEVIYYISNADKYITL